jgi:hypothetical protein
VIDRGKLYTLPSVSSEEIRAQREAEQEKASLPITQKRATITGQDGRTLRTIEVTTSQRSQTATAHVMRCKPPNHQLSSSGATSFSGTSPCLSIG